ncbi:MAG: hypothetical protein ACP5N3_00595 [Candidatus Nanoarchaeia archaeon]
MKDDSKLMKDVVEQKDIYALEHTVESLLRGHEGEYFIISQLVNGKRVYLSSTIMENPFVYLEPISKSIQIYNHGRNYFFSKEYHASFKDWEQRLGDLPLISKNKNTIEARFLTENNYEKIIASDTTIIAIGTEAVKHYFELDRKINEKKVKEEKKQQS